MYRKELFELPGTGDFLPPDYWYEEVDCPDCEGTGLIPEELDGEVERTECSRCDGTGYLIWDSKAKRFI